MENNVFTERLTEFGLTRQEACIYECLLMEGKTTGYEVAKKIGIPGPTPMHPLPV